MLWKIKLWRENSKYSASMILILNWKWTLARKFRFCLREKVVKSAEKCHNTENNFDCLLLMFSVNWIDLDFDLSFARFKWQLRGEISALTSSRISAWNFPPKWGWYPRLFFDLSRPLKGTKHSHNHAIAYWENGAKIDS